MIRLQKSIKAKIFLIFLGFTFAIFIISQMLVIYFARSDMKTIYEEKIISAHQRWATEAYVASTPEQLKAELIASLPSVNPDEVQVYISDLSGAEKNDKSNFYLPKKLDITPIQLLPPTDSFPQISQSLISLNDAEWTATQLITPRHVITSLINTAVLDRHINNFKDIRKKTVKRFFPFLLVLILLASFIVSKKVAGPIRRIQTSINNLDAQDLSLRLEHFDEDKEYVEFINAFNNMLSRLEKGFLQASRFSSNAAHELKTPLTIIQGYVERAINHSEPGSVIQIQLGMIADEIQRLNSITQKLLLLAQADSGRLALDIASTNVSDMLEELRLDIPMLAPQLEVRGSVEKRRYINTDKSLFQQILNNLLSNAIKYNVDKGWIEISAWQIAETLHMRFSNPSAAALESDTEKLFDRFYRGDLAHNRKIDGSGLGLSLCREIILANHGSINIKVDKANVITIDISLPAQPALV